MILAWQRKLLAGGGTKGGKPLSANTARLARSPLTGALKLAVEQGVIRMNPMTTVARPPTKRQIPKHWSPEQARQFLESQNGDHMYPLWAYLLGSGPRIGELVWLRSDNVDLVRQHARIVEFASILGWDLAESQGKSATATRIIDLDSGLVGVLEQQREMHGSRLADRTTSRPSTSSPSRAAANTTRRRSPCVPGAWASPSVLTSSATLALQRVAARSSNSR